MMVASIEEVVYPAAAKSVNSILNLGLMEQEKNHKDTEDTEQTQRRHLLFVPFVSLL